MPPFLDTNVLVYAYDIDERSVRSRGLLDDAFVIGVQTLNEFANVLSHRKNWSWPSIAQASHDLQALASVVWETTRTTTTPPSTSPSATASRSTTP